MLRNLKHINIAINCALWFLVNIGTDYLLGYEKELIFGSGSEIFRMFQLKKDTFNIGFKPRFITRLLKHL